MFKNLLFIAGSFILTGCSYFSINGMMCDQVASDPFATIPTECRNYNEDMATKASRIEKDILSPAEIIRFEEK